MHFKLHADSSKDIEVTVSGCHDNARQLGVPVKLLDILLALVDKEQLWGDVQRIRITVITLHRQIPQCHLVIGA